MRKRNVKTLVTNAKAYQCLRGSSCEFRGTVLLRNTVGEKNIGFNGRESPILLEDAISLKNKRVNNANSIQNRTY